MRYLLISLMTLAVASTSFSSTIDNKARTALITKLTAVYLNLAPNDPAKIALTLRLADLHAERARLEALEEHNKGCLECKGGIPDRKKALQYYAEVLPKLQDRSKLKVTMQMGHLYGMVGQEADSVRVFESLIKGDTPEEFKAEAQLSLGEVYFKKRQYDKARAQFAPLIQNPKSMSRGLAAYRTAWCDLNMGNQQAAVHGLELILKNKELLSRGSAENGAIDKQFHEEVSRDYATFLARGSVKKEHIDAVFSLSPESTAISNIVYLANELERLGQREMATEVWRFALERQSSPIARMESFVHIAQLEMLLSRRDASLTAFQSGLNLWPAVQPCSDVDLCKELKVRMKNYVVEWNKGESKQPSPQLLQAYQAYLTVFPSESDMNIWAAKVATEIKNYSAAFDLYSAAANLPGEHFEVALIGAVEVAELSKEKEMLERAYDQYLAKSKDRKRELEIQYQKARMIYERGEYAPASVALKDVALSKAPGSEELKKQAADLALDALVLLKDDANIGSWAREFSAVFPKFTQEFKSIGRKSILNQVVKVDVPKAQPEDLQKTWELLARYDLSDSTPADKIAYYKNRLILAEKMSRFPEARDATDQLLLINELSQEDREYALSRKAWLSEMILDFEGALAATEKLSDKVDREAKLLKLAMYAELAAKDAKPYYNQYMAISKDVEKTTVIAAEMVRHAKDPLKELEKHHSILAKKPAVLGAIYLELYAKTRSPDLIKKGLANTEIAQTVPGKLLLRWKLLNDYKKIEADLAKSALDSSQQKKMAASIKKRVALLNDVEKLAGSAVNAGDWSAQLLTLQLLADESDRFYQELMTLPIPQGLTPEEEQEYLQALSQQAAPFQIKAKDIKAKVAEFWSQKKAIDDLKSDIEKAEPNLKGLLQSEVAMLLEKAPDSVKAELTERTPAQQIAEAQAAKPTLAFLENARQGVRDNPLNRSNLENLLQVERDMGNQKMVSYLQGRLQSLASVADEGKEIK